MNRLLLSLVLAAASLLGSSYYATAQAPAPAKQWDKTFGGISDDRLTALQQTSDGGYILGGASISGISGDKTQANQGADDYWVIKLDAAGAKQWDKTFGSNGDDQLFALQQTRDGGYLLGGISRFGISGDKTQAGQGADDYWIVKLDATGTKQWDKSIGGSRDEVLTALQQTSDGGYILGGYSTSGISGDKTQASQGSLDYWVVKLDVAGTKQWDRSFGGSGSEQLNGLQQTRDGGYILGGYSSSGISGDKTQASQGNVDCWVIKLDAAGTKQWDKTFGGWGGDYLRALQQTSDGGYILGTDTYSDNNGDKTQASQGANDYWVVKLDAAGTKQWDKTFGGSRDDQFSSLQQTRDGGYILGGYSTSGISGDKTQASQGNADYWVVKLNPSGTKEWDKTLGGSAYNFLFALQQTSDGGYILGGASISGISGDKTQANQGQNDYWVIKLAADPLGTKAAATRSALAAYPNPTSTQLTLRGPVGTPYELLNQLGQVVRSGKLSAQPLDVHTLPAGLYLLRNVTTGQTSKLVKE